MAENYSFPITLPTIQAPYLTSLSYETRVSKTESPYNLISQKQVFDGKRWILDLKYRPLTREQAAEFQAFSTMLNGLEGTFLYELPEQLKTPLGTFSGTPMFSGPHPKGISFINVKGLTPSQVDIMKAGDFIQVVNHLHQIQTTVNSDAGGLTTIDIFPPLRANIPDETSIIFNNCKGIFELASNSVPVVQIDANNNFGFSLTAVEAIE